MTEAVAATAVLRAAKGKDDSTLQRIYAHHVLKGLASFEETPPDMGEMERRGRRSYRALSRFRARLNKKDRGTAFRHPRPKFREETLKKCVTALACRNAKYEMHREGMQAPNSSLGKQSQIPRNLRQERFRLLRRSKEKL